MNIISGDVAAYSQRTKHWNFQVPQKLWTSVKLLCANIKKLHKFDTHKYITFMGGCLDMIFAMLWFICSYVMSRWQTKMLISRSHESSAHAFMFARLFGNCLCFTHHQWSLLMPSFKCFICVSGMILSLLLMYLLFICHMHRHLIWWIIDLTVNIEGKINFASIPNMAYVLHLIYTHRYITL